jgi:coenzyme F420-0:L-glutamate ligase/coenzyme F420-1:gamma-L-glutamate ligase
MNRLVATVLPDIPLVDPGSDLGAMTLAGLENAGIVLQNKDVLVFASKIFSKAEGRYFDLNDIKPSPAAREIAAACDKDPRLVELILAESNQVMRIRPGLIVVEHRLGFVCANAGIDHSNTTGDEEIVLLLPTDPDRSARDLRQALAEATGADVAIIINDSHGRAWRQGTVGIAIGVAGMSPLTDRRGDPDIFGRTLRATLLGTADEIAAGASLLQGGADERAPIIHMRGVTYESGSGQTSDLLRPPEMDMFR